jgi:hypothetical protein
MKISTKSFKNKLFLTARTVVIMALIGSVQAFLPRYGKTMEEPSQPAIVSEITLGAKNEAVGTEG